MQLLDSDIVAFQALYVKRFGIRLDNKKAYQKLSMLVRQIEIVYQPVTKKQLKNSKDVDGNENERNQNIR